MIVIFHRTFFFLLFAIYFFFSLLYTIEVESCATLLSRELKSNLFHLFATWGGPYAKPLIVNHSGSSSGGGGSISNNGTVCAEEAKLQFGALTVCIKKKIEKNRKLVNLFVYFIQEKFPFLFNF